MLLLVGFFISVVNGSFHGRLCDSKCRQLSGSCLSIQANITNARMWTVSGFFFLKLLFSQPLSSELFQGLSLLLVSLSRLFSWAVWHSCRMGARNQEQTRGRIGPQLRLGNLRVGELHFCPLCTALDQASSLSR